MKVQKQHYSMPSTSVASVLSSVLCRKIGESPDIVLSAYLPFGKKTRVNPESSVSQAAKAHAYHQRPPTLDTIF